MKNSEILKELAIHIFNHAGSKDLSSLIYETLAYGKQIPAEAYYLIPDKRYHKEFPVVYGFLNALLKIKEPPYYIVIELVKKAAKEISLPFIDEKSMINLVLHTLIVDFFDKNPHFLKTNDAGENGENSQINK